MLMDRCATSGKGTLTDVAASLVSADPQPHAAGPPRPCTHDHAHLGDNLAGRPGSSRQTLIHTQFWWLEMSS